MSFADEVVVIGHRGAAGLAPENTLPSFRAAYACGVSAVELDVYVVGGEPVVIHDDTLDRTTNGTGPLMAQTLETLRALDAGGGARVPLLAEVVEELPPGVGLNIELKGPGTAVPVAGFLRRYADLDVLVSSFDHQMLRTFRRHDPTTPLAPLFSRWRAATPARLKRAAERGLRTFVYTINDLEHARALVALGATGVFTDYPDRITLDALTARIPG